MTALAPLAPLPWQTHEVRVGWSPRARCVWRTYHILADADATIIIADAMSAPIDLVMVDQHGLELIAVHVGEGVPRALANALGAIRAPVGTRRSVYLWSVANAQGRWRSGPVRREVGTAASALGRPAAASSSRPALTAETGTMTRSG